MTTPDLPPLLSKDELEIWLREPIAAADEDFADEILGAASWLIRNTARHPEWTAASAPPRARYITAHLAARSFRNPDSISAEGGVGPLGGDRTVEDMARALHLTATETEELVAMAPAGSGLTSGSGLWVQPFGDPTPWTDGDVYLGDSSGSDWMIPYLHEDDLPALG